MIRSRTIYSLMFSSENSDVALPVSSAEPATAYATAPERRADLRVLGAVRRIVRSVQAYSRQLEREHGLSVTQLMCLTALNENGILPLKGLADQVRMAPSSLVGVVDRLVEMALVTRDRDTQDRRKLTLAITDKGRVVVDESPALLDELLALRLNQLPEDRRQNMANVLEELVGLMPFTSATPTAKNPLGIP
ncbi:MAG: MarR family winged helix-turn-helix transcriptional regulator [Opitutales bacterium]